MNSGVFTGEGFLKRSIRSYAGKYKQSSSVLFLFYSCKKDSVKPADSEQHVEASAFFQRNAPETQTFQGDAASGFTIQGKQGTKIKFSPGAFLDQEGKPVDGQIEVSLTEMYSMKDLWITGVSTVTDKERIFSATNMFEVEATQNGQLLTLNQSNTDGSVSAQFFLNLKAINAKSTIIGHAVSPKKNSTKSDPSPGQIPMLAWSWGEKVNAGGGAAQGNPLYKK